MLLNDLNNQIRGVNVKLERLKNVSFLLEKQSREFSNFIQFYSSKNSKYYSAEIKRFKRYLKKIRIEMEENQKKMEEYQMDLIRLQMLTENKHRGELIT